MITEIVASTCASGEPITWTDVAFIGVLVAGVLGFFWLKWR